MNTLDWLNRRIREYLEFKLDVLMPDDARTQKMATYTIDLPEESSAELEQLAKASGVSPERVLADKIEQMLDDFRIERKRFSDATDYVLKKNQELYRRLA